MVLNILLGIWFLIMVATVFATVVMHRIIKKYQANEEESIKENLQVYQNWLYVFIAVWSVTGIGLFYASVVGTVWERHLLQWLNLAIRLTHITLGIAWIGASFYFVFLENSLNRTKNIRDELAGNLWAIHGGGFYYLEKYKLAPEKIPKELHWFKYEAYFTWLSGFCLLIVVYYFNANSILIDPTVRDLSPATAISIGIGSLAIGWLIYDLICKTLSKNKIVFTLAITIFVCCAAWFYTQVFSGRAAFMHFGAMLGTLMAANVFFVIIPGQKRMVKAAKAGKSPNPADGKAAGLRSYTNNYFTLPVLFVMISNHFPSTFSNDLRFWILLAITFGTAGIKHYLNLREKGQLSVWIMPASILILMSAFYMASPKPIVTENCKQDVAMEEVQIIINRRCTHCHANEPADEIWTIAPNGIIFESVDDIIRQKQQIYERSVLTHNMPFNNNQTGMTQEERDLLACWINQN